MMPRYWIDIYKDDDGWWVASVWDTNTGKEVWGRVHKYDVTKLRREAADKVRELLAKDAVYDPTRD